MRRWIALLATSVLVAAAAVAESEKMSVFALEKVTAESMLWEEVTADMGNQSVQGIMHGLGATGESMIAYKLDGRYELFSAYVGYLKNTPKTRKCKFEVLADGESLYTSPEMNGEEDPEFIKVPVKGKNILMMRIKPSSYGATQGAAYGQPYVYNGVSPADLEQNLTVDVDGKKTTMPMKGGRFPRELTIPIPLTGGNVDYKVHVVQDTANKRVKITTEKVGSP